MAHSPEKKAAALADLAKGETYRNVAQEHKVSVKQLQRWTEEMSTKRSQGQIQSQAQESRQDRFNQALDRFLFSTITMLQAWADTASQPEFIRENPQGVNELGKTVLERADRLVSIIGDGKSTQGEQSED